MTSLDKRAKSSLSIIQAVETLSKIADLDVRFSPHILWHPLSIEDKEPSAETLRWLEEQDPQTILDLVKATFGVILRYLRHFYKQSPSQNKEENTIEGIKLIMVLVGEAAKKLDQFAKVFQKTGAKSVKELREYRQLQEFYQTRIAKKVDQGVLGRWLYELTKRAFSGKREESDRVSKLPPLSTRHVFVDLEAVKKDHEYDLLLIRKEDGSRFFNPRLIRNIKLVCDFETSLVKSDLASITDPLDSLKIWQDQCFQASAKQIYRSLGHLFDDFYVEAEKYKKMEIVEAINKAIIALLLARNPSHLLKYNPTKTCTEYFSDFQFYLQQALKSKEYEKWIAYPPSKEGGIAHQLLDTIHSLAFSLFISTQGYQEAIPYFEKIIQEAMLYRSKEHSEVAKHSQMLWMRLAGEYTAVMNLLKKHPNGPLNKVLEILQEGSYHFFDPIEQQNLPGLLYSIQVEGHPIANIRIPTPTHQEYIHKAHIKEEFRAFLRKLAEQKLKHVLINLQDRTSWREHFRCQALEELQESSEFASPLVVVTVPHDTDFYLQQTPYDKESSVVSFMKNLKINVLDEASGFYFPRKIKSRLPNFLATVLTSIHAVFFEGRNVLSKESRIDFIEIFHLFLNLFILDVIKPASFSFTCKDAIDIGGAENVLFFAFLKTIGGESLTEEDMLKLNMILYGPSLILRERAMLPERFYRMLGALKVIESKRSELGKEQFKEKILKEFGALYTSGLKKTHILNS